jgi:hypothetical protein
MLSINQATQVLHIGKPRLYRLMKKFEISPIPDGHRKILTENQIEILKEVIASSYSKVVSTKTGDELGTSSVQTGDELGTSSVQTSNEPDQTDQTSNNKTTYEPYRELLKSKDEQIQHLQKIIELEQQERKEKDQRHDEVLKEFNQSTERFQAMLMQLQTKNSELNQKLLEAPKEGVEMNVSREAFKDKEREVVAISETIQPFPEQQVQAQNRFFTPVIWATAAIVLTISIVEFGGFSISSLVRDLLASR